MYKVFRFSYNWNVTRPTVVAKFENHEDALAYAKAQNDRLKDVKRSAYYTVGCR